MAMVVRANQHEDGIGGHISTYASAATLYEVGFNHFFRGRGESGFDGDLVYFQGHASPGIYARAFLEGRLAGAQLENFRRELAPGGGLSSYPHPWLMPDFWEFPTVSMGLGPIIGDLPGPLQPLSRGPRPGDTAHRRVWAFLGDGETDEPESLGAHHPRLARAARQPDLRGQLQPAAARRPGARQRQDHPGARGGLPRRRLERHQGDLGRRLGSAARPRHRTAALVQRMNEALDGEYQKYSVEGGAYIREHFFGTYPELAASWSSTSPTSRLHKLRRGGHDPEKVYAAYKAATETKGAPTVILAKTIKGYGLGEAGEGKNVTHQQKKLNEEELRDFRDRFDIPIAGRASSPRRRSTARPDGSPEIEYLHDAARRARRLRAGAQAVDGAAGRRRRRATSPSSSPAGDREVSTTMALRAAAAAAAAGPEDRQAHRADRPRRGAHLRHGVAVPPARHLRPQGPALRAGRLEDAAVLQGGQGRADPRGGDHRGRLDGLVHRRRHRLRDATAST